MINYLKMVCRNVLLIDFIVLSDADLKKTTDLLNDGKKVAMLIGAGAMNVGNEVKQVAELLGAGGAKGIARKSSIAR